jgi:hypothetical protein
MIALHPNLDSRQSDPIQVWLTSPPSLVDLIQYAILYRSLGWNVLPVAGKKVAVAWRGWQCKRVPKRLLIRLLERKGVTGLAVLCGWISGWPGRKLCVRDFDTVEAYQRWAEQHPSLAVVLPTVRTRRGYHVYCWSPFELNLKFSDGELKASSKTYVLLPPSVHPEGEVYTWVIPFPINPEGMPVLDPREAGLIPSDTKAFVDPTPVGGVTQAVLKSMEVFGRASASGLGESVRVRGSVQGESDGDEPSVFGSGVWDAIETSQPSGPGERNVKLFELARQLKGLPHLADSTPADLEPYVWAWWVRALSVIRTRDWRTSWAEFLTAWNRVAFPAGEGPARRLMEAAAAGPEPIEAAGFPDPAVRRLIAVCQALQDAANRYGGDHFFLSCRSAAAVCGFSGLNGYRTASRWLRRLVEDGLLELVERGIPGLSHGKASCYRVRPCTRDRTEGDKRCQSRSG